jgi:RimJ/RimL family protein N-acetyltransferase
MRTLHDGDLTLEPQTAQHANAMFTVLSDPAIYEYLDEAPPASVEALRERFQWLETRASPDGRDHWLNWVVRTPEAGPIGFVQATVHPGGSADIAFVLASGSWGRGLAFRASRVMIQELAERYGVRRLVATAARGNARSLRLLGRLGFAVDERSRSAGGEDVADEVRLTRELPPLAAGLAAPRASGR